MEVIIAIAAIVLVVSLLVAHDQHRLTATIRADMEIFLMGMEQMQQSIDQILQAMVRSQEEAARVARAPQQVSDLDAVATTESAPVASAGAAPESVDFTIDTRIDAHPEPAAQAQRVRPSVTLILMDTDELAEHRRVQVSPHRRPRVVFDGTTRYECVRGDDESGYIYRQHA